MIRYGATTLQTNTWYNIAGVYDAAAQTLHVYLKVGFDHGQLLGTVTTTQQISALDLKIGQRPRISWGVSVGRLHRRCPDCRSRDYPISILKRTWQRRVPPPVSWSYTTPALLVRLPQLYRQCH